MTLWQHDTSPDSFTAGQDAALDQQLLEPDILVNLAHSQMLHEQGYLEQQELAALHEALLQLLDDPPDVSQYEDVHTCCEEQVTAATDAGKKLHTGRSRNDQVAADTLLWIRQQTIQTADKVLDLIEALEELGDGTVVPGQTHTRQAMPTTAENWAGSHAAALLDALDQLEQVHEQCLACPLGAAAGFGTHLNLDRQRVADLLGFEEPASNTIHAVQLRGQASLGMLQAVQSLGLAAANFADDLVTLTKPGSWLELDDDMTTGSSIMPQKQNPDGLELVRARGKQLLQQPGTVASVLTGGPTGYSRDTQQTKPVLMQSVGTLQDCLEALTEHVQHTAVDGEAADELLHDDITAAQEANQLVEDGVPFREAYHQVKQQGGTASEPVPAASSFPDASSHAETWQQLQEQENAWKQELLDLAAAASDG
ncbi:MAG: lyase family protein [Candidatus Nanohaloarchaea archaeon]|nr:lyase family protein [Candidatus Nanohaloarchaea archaeon]